MVQEKAFLASQGLSSPLTCVLFIFMTYTVLQMEVVEEISIMLSPKSVGCSPLLYYPSPPLHTHIERELL